MKKRLTTIALFLLVVITAVLPIHAETDDGFTSEYARLLDDAYLLDDTQYDDILSQLDELSVRQSFDLVVHTTEYLGEGYDSVVDYADDIYDYCGFGYQYGEDRDGAILVIALETRDVYISTRGYGITAFTDYGIQTIIDEISGYFTDGDYYSGICEFISMADEYITAARNGTPIDVGDGDGKVSVMFRVVVSSLVGLLVAGITVGSMKSKHKTVRNAVNAADYVRKDSLVVAPERSRDIYLYATHTKTKRESESSSSGGSSTHTSSSGASHGGGGGKF